MVPVRLPPGFACDTVAQEIVCTVATATYVLLLVFGSGGVPESVTVAVLAKDPAAAAVTVIATVAVAPLASVARVHVTGPVPAQVIVGEVTDTNVNPADSASVKVMVFAADGPLLETVMS